MVQNAIFIAQNRYLENVWHLQFKRTKQAHTHYDNFVFSIKNMCFVAV